MDHTIDESIACKNFGSVILSNEILDLVCDCEKKVREHTITQFNECARAQPFQETKQAG